MLPNEMFAVKILSFSLLKGSSFNRKLRLGTVFRFDGTGEGCQWGKVGSPSSGKGRGCAHDPACRGQKAIAGGQGSDASHPVACLKDQPSMLPGNFRVKQKSQGERVGPFYFGGGDWSLIRASYNPQTAGLGSSGKNLS